MQPSVSTLDEDWNISGSDEEGEPSFALKNNSKAIQDPKKKKKKGANGETNSVIPRKIALLYKEIERNGLIEIQCKCPRRGPGKNDSQSQNSNLSQTSTGSVSARLETTHISKDTTQAMKIKNKPEYQGFDYKDDEDRMFISKPTSAKKTPVSAKRAKKVASMANVVNDLLRQKMLDELENGPETSGKWLKAENPNAKVSLEFDKKDSVPDVKDGLATQISRVEALLDSKDSKNAKERRSEKE